MRSGDATGPANQKPVALASVGKHTKLPVAVTVFPAEIYPARRSWGDRTFGNLIYWNEVHKRGHFAAWEQPEIFSQELRAAFKSLR